MYDNNVPQQTGNAANIGTNYAGAAIGGSGVAPVTLVAATHEELEKLVSGFSHIEQRMRSLKTRIFGEVPQNPANKGESPRPAGQWGAVAEKIEYLRMIQADMLSLMTELERVA